MDREKIIKGLKICRHGVISQENCMECPYIYDGRAKQSNCEDVLHRDALALLKEQDEIIQNVLREKTNELNSKVAALQIEVQNREMKRLLEQK